MALARRAGAGKKTMGAYGLVAELYSGYLGPLWVAHSSQPPFAGMPLAGRRIPQARGADEQALESLREVADWAVSLEHELLVGVLACERDEEELVVVSAYHEGETLRSLLRLTGIGRKPMPADIVLRVIHDVLAAVAHLHHQQYGEEPLQAAVNPDNVIVCSDGRTRLLEPGLSMVAAATKPWADDPKRAAYDPPEKLAGEAAGPEGDVFGVGVLMWELLRNRPLFAALNVAAVQKRMAGPVRRVDALAPTGGKAIEAGVADVVERALERDVDERFVSAAEMLAAVEAEAPATHEQVADWLAELAAAALAKQRRKVNEVASMPPPAPAPPTPPKKVSSAPPAALVVSSRPPKAVDMPTIPAAPVAKKKPAAAGVDKSTRLGMLRLPQPDYLAAEPAADDATPFETKADAIPPPAQSPPRTPARAAAQALFDEPTNQEGTPGDIARTSDVFGAAAVMEAAATPAPRPPPAAASAPGAASPQSPDDSGGLFSIADDPSMDGELPPEALRALERARKAEKRSLAVPILVAGALLVVVVILIALLLTGDDAGGALAPNSGAASASIARPAQACDSIDLMPSRKDPT